MDELRLRRGQEPDHRIREKPGLAFGYVQPTAGGCITSPDSPWLRQIVLGAALVSIVFVPLPMLPGYLPDGVSGKHACQRALRRLDGTRPGAAVIAAITGTALWRPAASAHDVEPQAYRPRRLASRDGHDIRLVPSSWYALTQASDGAARRDPRYDVRSESVRRSVCIDMKLTVQTFLTLDGVMQAPGGPEEDPSEAFTHGGWQAPFPDPAVGEFVTELTSHASAFLFGRRTFDIFRGYWPDQTDPANPIATAINSLPKYVVSGSLSQADATWRGEHPGTARLVTGDVAAAVQALKDEPGDELQIWGSSHLLQTLLQHELVDRFRLMTFPLVLGSGRRLFNDGILPATMRPAGLTVTDLGIVIGTYEPAGPVRHGQM